MVLLMWMYRDGRVGCIRCTFDYALREWTEIALMAKIVCMMKDGRVLRKDVYS